MENDKYIPDKDLSIVDDIFESVRTAAKAIVADMDYPPELDKHIKYKVNYFGLNLKNC